MTTIETTETTTTHKPNGNTAGAAAMLHGHGLTGDLTGATSKQGPNLTGAQSDIELRREVTSRLRSRREAVLKLDAEQHAEALRIVKQIDNELGVIIAPDPMLDPGTVRLLPSRDRARAGVKGAKGARTPTKTTKGQKRLARRSLTEIDALVGKIVALVKRHPAGIRAEKIRQDLQLDVREMPRVLRRGVAQKLLRTKGEKRATTYFAKA